MLLIWVYGDNDSLSSLSASTLHIRFIFLLLLQIIFSFIVVFMISCSLQQFYFFIPISTFQNVYYFSFLLNILFSSPSRFICIFSSFISMYKWHALKHQFMWSGMYVVFFGEPVSWSSSFLPRQIYVQWIPFKYLVHFTLLLIFADTYVNFHYFFLI